MKKISEIGTSLLDDSKFDTLAGQFKEYFGGSGFGLLTLCIKKCSDLDVVEKKFLKTKEKNAQAGYLLNSF